MKSCLAKKKWVREGINVRDERANCVFRPCPRKFTGFTEEEMIDNARLCAAAPKLYFALSELVGYVSLDRIMKADTIIHDTINGKQTHLKLLLDIANEALNKADGDIQ